MARFKSLWRCLVVAIAALLVTLVGPDPAVTFSFIIGIAASIMAIVRAAQLAPPELQYRISALTASVLLLCMFGALGSVVLSQARTRGVSAVSRANLRGLHHLLHEYHGSHDAYPVDLPTVVELGLQTWDGLRAPADPRCRLAYRSSGSKHVSYVYCPPTGPWSEEPSIILAHEREAWIPVGGGFLTPKYGRYVLYADGRVDELDEYAFVDALRADEQVRASGQPSIVSAVRPSDVHAALAPVCIGMSREQLDRVIPAKRSPDQRPSLLMTSPSQRLPAREVTLPNGIEVIVAFDGDEEHIAVIQSRDPRVRIADDIGVGSTYAETTARFPKAEEFGYPGYGWFVETSPGVGLMFLPEGFPDRVERPAPDCRAAWVDLR